MKLLFLIEVYIISFFSCTNPTSKGIKNDTGVDVSENLINLFWGSTNKFDSTNVLETAVYYLNISKFKKAIEVLQHQFPMDTVKNGGFYGFEGRDNFEPNKYKLYTFFRLNDYGGNIVGNKLESELIRSLLEPKENLYLLQGVEDNYISSGMGTDNNSSNAIAQILDLKKKFSNSKRLDFLLANEYLKINDSHAALEIFDILIAQNYYALPALRNIIEYLSESRSQQLNKYLKIFEKSFPSECNIRKIGLSIDSIDEGLLQYECKKCFESTFQIDSLRVRLLLARYYLNMRKLDKVDSLVNEYLNIDNKPYDEERLYEKGFYYDLKMQILFLRGQYKELCKFSKSLQPNPVVSIENDQELKLYLEKLFKQFSYTENQFDTFYMKNFKDCY